MVKFNIEGIDGSGKTTLANKLGEKNKILHADSNTPNTFEWHWNEMHNESNEVFDRFYIGEWVWSKVYNRECKLDDEDIQILIDSFPGVHIYCYNNKWKEVLLKRGEGEQIPEKRLALKYYEEFFTKFDFSKTPLFRWEIDVVQ